MSQKHFREIREKSKTVGFIWDYQADRPLFDSISLPNLSVIRREKHCHIQNCPSDCLARKVIMGSLASRPLCPTVTDNFK